MDPLDFTGRAVVVTGGTRGIGAAIAAAFRAAGADVLICGRTPPTSSPVALPGHRSAPSVSSSSAAASSGVEFFQADVRDPAQAAALIEAAIDRFGRVDVVINNAGGSPEVPAGEASPRLHAKIIELNLLAPLHVAQAANAVMRDQDTGGVILMIGSVSGTRPSPGTAAYGAAKAGLHHLATSLAAEWAPRVRVNTLVVGPVEASGSAGAGSAGAGSAGAGSAGAGSAGAGSAGAGSAVAPARGGVHDDLGRRDGRAASTVARTVPMGRAATAGEVAGACLLLASPLAGYISGASLAVHGGGEWPAYLADLRDTAYRAEK
ncbi:SDR family oxidoreductase [Actinoplanes sichuanensis]|uniref:SDR family oxidoreductase n=1 Tax=Actinoplanes sichuanensis TaxID=512349 RepID=A0ABW4AMY4_9ACTN|nr:SDR family oxidoreductase [Actinoplanes sichuanensis]BEL08310.1 SDR family oxidoreductase [Actinoplanes sichuanensis]